MNALVFPFTVYAKSPNSHTSWELGLYYIKPTKRYVAMKAISREIWHDQLGYPELGIMRGTINNNFAGHRDFPNPKDFICTTCAKGKVVTRSSLLKIRDEPHKMG
jgi:hypothetical protein